MDSLNVRYLLLYLPLIMLLYSCGSTDTVTVVEQEPRSATETAEESPEAMNDDTQFIQVNVGLLEPVTNLDPLFADNLSSLRAVSLIYESLFSLDRQGNPVPDIVNDYSISEDQRQYEFKINRDLYYHDNEVFNAGVGRRIHADDIKWAFERTARVDVPPAAAQLLMNISGYESYFAEQRKVFDPKKRVLEGVTGIEVIDPGTIRFILHRPDEDFLKKLASPLLSIYPGEAVTENEKGLHTNPVGTGAYTLNSLGEERIILSRNSSQSFSQREQNYPINRIDLVYFSSESDMFQQFVRKEIDWIPELGPQSKNQLIDEQQNLQATYRNQFEITKQDANRYTLLYFNEKSDRYPEWVRNRIARVSSENFTAPGSIELRTQEFAGETDTTKIADSLTLFIAFTDSPYSRLLFSDLTGSVFEPEASLNFVDIRTPTSDTSLFSRSTDSFHFPIMNRENLSGYWLSNESQIIGVHHSYLDGIQSSHTPWYLPVESVEVDNSERDAQ